MGESDWLTALGSGIVVLISYHSIREAMPEEIRSWLTPIAAGIVAGVASCLLRKAANLPTRGELRDNSVRDQNDQAAVYKVEDRLDELERLKRRDMVTPEEYAAKRQEILKDLSIHRQRPKA
jgi:hypothetical protein